MSIRRAIAWLFEVGDETNADAGPARVRCPEQSPARTFRRPALRTGGGDSRPLSDGRSERGPAEAATGEEAPRVVGHAIRGVVELVPVRFRRGRSVERPQAARRIAARGRLDAGGSAPRRPRVFLKPARLTAPSGGLNDHVGRVSSNSGREIWSLRRRTGRGGFHRGGQEPGRSRTDRQGAAPHCQPRSAISAHGDSAPGAKAGPAPAGEERRRRGGLGGDSVASLPGR